VVENYRAFRHAEMTLPEEGLVLVAGANNSGESALLSAFDVVAGSIDEAGSRRQACGRLQLAAGYGAVHFVR